MFTNQTGQVAQASLVGQGAVSRPDGVLKQAQPVAPDTLLRALANMESLNKRLSELTGSVNDIAIAIGGPWPCDGDEGKPDSPSQPPAMVILNASVDLAHRRVSAIEQAVGAIRRSLGG